jgi:hypothetical protein
VPIVPDHGAPVELPPIAPRILRDRSSKVASLCGGVVAWPRLGRYEPLGGFDHEYNRVVTVLLLRHRQQGVVYLGGRLRHVVVGLVLFERFLKIV